MHFHWIRWEPTEHHAYDCPDKALVEAINVSLDTGRAEEIFLGLWRYWWSRFPNACILGTLTQRHFGGTSQQLRLWFGERVSFSTDHVNSDGHNLIVQVSGTSKHLRELVEQVLPKGVFEEGVQEPNDREWHAAPRQIVVWRRVCH